MGYCSERKLVSTSEFIYYAQKFTGNQSYKNLDEQFIGHRLVNSEYVAIPTNEDGEIFSTELQAVLRPEGKFLRVVDPRTGLLVPSLDEAVEIAEQEAQRAEQATQRANATDAENVRLRAELEALRQQRS